MAPDKYSVHATESPLGRLLVAVTDRGICAVKMADTDKELGVTCRDEFSAANIKRDDDGLRDGQPGLAVSFQ
jgi:hypothetical protein